jgi:homoserine kinase
MMIPVLLNAACTAGAFVAVGLWSAAAAAVAGLAAAWQALSLIVA